MSQGIEGEATLVDVRSVSCCPNKGMCHKQEVEPEDNRILVYSGSGKTYDKVNVNTHVDRYTFCRDNPSNIYCVNDPRGDAFTEPAPQCDGEDCDVADCRTKFNEAENLSDYCRIIDVTYSADGFCTFDTTCEGNNRHFYTEGVEVYINRIEKRLQVCANPAGYYLFNKAVSDCQ